jgi:UDP-glucose 4-epimerase
MVNVLVTGGAGFIGSNLADKLVDLGYQVVIIDNFLTGSKKNVNSKATFYEKDIRHIEELDEIFEKEKPEYVFHLAAGYLVQSLEDPQRDAEINIIGSINLIRMCLKHKVKRIIYSNSGGASYGNPEKLPLTEDHPIHPLTPYGASKYTAEMYFYMYNKNHNLDYISLRYANIYGPRQDPKLEGGVVSVFVDAVLKNKTPQIFGDGSVTRDYCYVGDVVDANIIAMKNGVPGGYQVGNGEEISVLEVLESIKKELGSEVQPSFVTPRMGDCQRSVFDITKVKEGLQWKPKTSFEEGIRKTVEWQKNNPEG